MRAARFLFLAGALAGAGCLDGAGVDGATAEGDVERRPDWPTVVIGGGELVLDCSKTDAPDLHVLFECDSVTIYSCEEMSDAVLDYESGRSQRFARLHGQVVTLAARGVHDGQRIVSVRVPGDGSDRDAVTGGERRIAAPDDSCGPPPVLAADGVPAPSR